MLRRSVLGAPIGLFLVNALTFALCWQTPTFPAVVALAGVFASLQGGYALGAAMPAVAGCGAVSFGALTGLYAHEAYLGPYFATTLGQSYTNVLASMPASAYGDAGLLRFAETSGVDSSRAVGFRDRRTYCAAPILDEGGAQTRTVGFWAVGLDCCGARSSFECGAAGNRTARGGLRLQVDGLLERERSQYLRAIALAASVGGLTVEPEPILVHWSQDPGAEANLLLVRSFGVLGLGLALFLLLVFVAAATTVLAKGSAEEPLPR